MTVELFISFLAGAVIAFVALWGSRSATPPKPPVPTPSPPPPDRKDVSDVKIDAANTDIDRGTLDARLKRLRAKLATRGRGGTD